MPAGPKSEEAFQRHVVMLAQTYGWRVMHTRPAMVGGKWMTPIQGDPGFPDLVLAHPERGIIFAELKTETGKLRAAQRDWSAVLLAANAEWYLWRPDDLHAIMRRLSLTGP